MDKRSASNKIIIFLLKSCGIAILFSVIGTAGIRIICGFLFYNPEYGSCHFYSWREDYLNPLMSKTAYERIKLNSFPESDDLKSFVSKVQGDELKEENLYPLYSDGVTDTLLPSPKDAWAKFGSGDKFNLEMEFLKFRTRYLMFIHNIEFDPSHELYDALNKSSDKKSDSKKPKTTSYLKGGSKTIFSDKKTKDGNRTLVREFFEGPGSEKRDFNGIYSDFKTFVENLKSGDRDYKVTVGKKDVELSKDLSEDLTKLLNKAMPGFDITEEKLKKFFRRVVWLDLTPLDIHMIDRFLFYWCFITADEDVTERRSSKDYKKYEKLYNTLKNDSKPDNEEKTFKLGTYRQKMNMYRLQITLAEFSEIFIDKIGKHGAILKKEDDKRNILRRYGSPSVKRKSIAPLHSGSL